MSRKVEETIPLLKPQTQTKITYYASNTKQDGYVHIKSLIIIIIYYYHNFNSATLESSLVQIEITTSHKDFEKKSMFT